MALPSVPCLFFLFPLMAAFYLAHGEGESPSNCSKEFSCGNIGYLESPFAKHTQADCGLVAVNCDTTPPKIQLEKGEDWYHLQKVKKGWGVFTITVEDSKLQGLFDRRNCKILNYSIQFQSSPSITLRNFEPYESSTFLKCNDHSQAYDDLCNYERYNNCTEGYSLYYKRPLITEDPACIPDSCIPLPIPIFIHQTNDILTAGFGVELQVTEACYYCHYGGGQCRADSNNEFQCKKDELPSNCTKGFLCGSMGYLEFPFAQQTQPHCGLVAVNCDTTPPKIQLEKGEDWYHLQKVIKFRDVVTIFVEDSKLRGLFERRNCKMLNYSIQFRSSPSITLRNFEPYEFSTFLKCNDHSQGDHDICSYERYKNCTEGYSLYYKRPLIPEDPACIPDSCIPLPTPIFIDQTNDILTTRLGVELQVTEACYHCYNGGGQCRADSNNDFQCKKDEFLPSNCTKGFLCGSMGYLEFPFAQHTQPHCGLIVVDCDAKPLPNIQLETGGDWYQLLRVKPPVWGDYVIFLGDLKLQRFLEYPPNYSNLNYTLQLPNSPSITFHNLEAKELPPVLKCNYSEADDMGNYEMYNCTEGFSFSLNYKRLLIPENPKCDTVYCTLYPTPILIQQKIDVLTAQFGLYLEVSQTCHQCYQGGGQCIEAGKNQFHCAKGNTRKRKLKRLVLVAGGAALVLIMFTLLLFIIKKLSSFCSKRKKYQETPEFLNRHGFLALKRFSYSEVKKITTSFKDELGQGGFGSVYKGKLRNGSLVAVKVLKELRASGEDFINEVASISRTSHVNIVTLIGFCIEGRKRALVYEFMPNGSLEKFIYNTDPLTGRQLGWNMLYKISIGIARGLEYLHRGCNTRILHLDIKPHNILLDEDFSPKISDFGLAKLCTKKESIVSIFGARGTIGYIAPELVCKNIGGVSHKSDVYSYGMMVLEMVGGRRNVDVGVSRNSKIYFPHWIYSRLILDDELGLIGVMNEEENECARKMVIVSLWCIQTDPSTRPSMSKVVEMLEGNLENLQIPPQPYLYSPATSEEQHSSVVFIS
ncbi:PREDICTED: LEAF RUST 10 DISEASE-RESISTANCE LOCUS RECEPTOR-LIKE PROTEIN KINASE-like 2.8 isoform X1 [Ipomoea nil]|uniref:LEAF RUST 10 DISEASE-RESISTANCE LOCUS RECEPTOR-LIKE PROTEIN KINASE-like 2.8 isoform X1 n=1 Tax=Ipomoea nil TaxID=35883 RepID=UPI000901B414|nr:PREDICTED: LEAF RUST 10 DISEASE-RESISTANCE LOCUS RECEPTOR-LIKE PROTEIN KINASE-like 2.8 isoform X1 [Ipomoea nil]